MSKKKEKDAEVTKQPKMEAFQTDHELFMQAFESKCFLFVFVLVFLFVSWRSNGQSFFLCCFFFLNV